MYPFGFVSLENTNGSLPEMLFVVASRLNVQNYLLSLLVCIEYPF